MYSHLEDFIYDLYKSINILEPYDLDTETIAKKMGVKIVYEKQLFRINNEIILINSTKKQEWMNFGHELGHYLRHSGSQVNMHPLFIDLQEWQANNFAYHFCVPIFMLDKLNIRSAYDIMNYFDVDYNFAVDRLEMYKVKYHEKEWSFYAHSRVEYVD